LGTLARIFIKEVYVPMKMYVKRRTLGIGVFVLAAALSSFGFLNTQSSKVAGGGCTDGKLSAKLTGWMMNEEMPSGTAGFNTEKNLLTVTVESVNLPDGTKLAVLIGEKRIGELEALAKGGSKGEISLDKDLAEGDRIRVFHDKVPVVSGNLVCESNQK
jgi:hypothetical protein